MRIWVTRTAPDNVSTARRIRMVGHEAIAAPVLEVLSMAATVPTGAPDALVFTSMNGVRHHPFSSKMRGLPVFAVGERTAAAAWAAGYVDVRSADGAVDDLRALIVDGLAPPAMLVHYCAELPAGNLEQDLAPHGLWISRVAVYATRETPLAELGMVTDDLSAIDGIVIHSPRAAGVVAEAIASSGWSGTVWCISEACRLRLTEGIRQEQLRACRIHCALHPSEAALMRLVAACSPHAKVDRLASMSVAEHPFGPPPPHRSEPANDDGNAPGDQSEDDDPSA